MKYQVRVKPGSSQEKIILSDTEITVFLRAKAHDGEANDALIKLLAKHFHVGKTHVKILRGQKSKQKLIEILEK